MKIMTDRKRKRQVWQTREREKERKEKQNMQRIIFSLEDFRSNCHLSRSIVRLPMACAAIDNIQLLITTSVAPQRRHTYPVCMMVAGCCC